MISEINVLYYAISIKFIFRKVSYNYRLSGAKSFTTIIFHESKGKSIKY